MVIVKKNLALRADSERRRAVHFKVKRRRGGPARGTDSFSPVRLPATRSMPQRRYVRPRAALTLQAWSSKAKTNERHTRPGSALHSARSADPAIAAGVRSGDRHGHTDGTRRVDAHGNAG